MIFSFLNSFYFYGFLMCWWKKFLYHQITGNMKNDLRNKNLELQFIVTVLRICCTDPKYNYLNKNRWEYTPILYLIIRSCCSNLKYPYLVPKLDLQST